MSLESVIDSIEKARDNIISDMVEMIRIPAIGPFNGGEGETARADHLMSYLKDFDVVERKDVADIHFPSVNRPNIIAKKFGKEKGTVWIVSHMDTVLPGDLSKWDSPPFEPKVDGDRIFGLGAEDNGQAVIASIYGAKFIENGSLSKKSIGLAIVSDEETTSLMGISHLIDEGCFSEDDVIIVPDWGVPGGTMIEVAEKHLLWFKVCVNGKQIHGSIPDKGLNSFRISADLICKLSDRLKEKFGNSNPIFRPSVSTFEPTKSYSDPVSVNIIPGYFEFYMDCRILPEYDPEIVFDYVKRIVSEYSEETEAEIGVVLEQMTFSGKPSSTDSEAFKAFRESVEAVVDGKVETVGVGGGTCANFFRLKGMDAYVWQTGGGTLHQPNEHVFVSNIISDAKVYANLFYRLCV